MDNLRYDAFNLIASGCGTGKSRFCSKELLSQLPNVNPYEVLYLTSRSITVDQMVKDESLDKFYADKLSLVQYWNSSDSVNEQDLSEISRCGIQVMTYDKIINILVNQNNDGCKTLGKIKVVIVDECHTLFCDSFINNIEVLKVWIRDMVCEGEKLFIGLTATPGIVQYYKAQWGVPVRRINKEILVQYKAKQLICTDFNTIPYLVATNHFEGKTLVMCKSIKDCLELQSKLSNAAVMVSKQNSKYYTKELNEIRNYIVENRTLPDTFVYVNSEKGTRERRPLDILISTSTLREGFTLLPQSGVKNVICCYTDEMNITQFVGRCRFNIENLVVADIYHRSDNLKSNTYFGKCEQDYQAFVHNFENIKWFNSISHLVSHSWEDTQRVVLGKDERRFIDYINTHWLVPIGCSCKDSEKYRIYKEEDKKAIVDMAFECDLFRTARDDLTFNRVVRMLKETLGYEVVSGRLRFQSEQYTYKLVLSYDGTEPKENLIYL